MVADLTIRNLEEIITERWGTTVAQEERGPTAIAEGTADTIDSIVRQHHITELDHLARTQTTTERLETGCPEFEVRITKQKEAVIHQMHHPIAAVLVKIPAIEF